MARGKYIVIEGNDGTGKTTQAELLQNYLEDQGKTVLMVHEPGGTPMGDALRTIIKDGSIERSPESNLLLFTAARHELWPTINAALEAGTWVISSRNYLSTIVYQGYAEGLDAKLITAITRQFTAKAYMEPEHTIILTIDDDATRTQRVANRKASQPDTFESKDQDYQKRLKQGYREVANDTTVVIAANGTPRQTLAAIVHAIG